MKERLKENYNNNKDTMKTDFLEWIVICQYMSDSDFNNLFRLEELSEQEFFNIVEFLYRQECYIILFMVIARHIKRFQNNDISFIDDIDFIDRFDERLERLKDFKDFSIPLL